MMKDNPKSFIHWHFHDFVYFGMNQTYLTMKKLRLIGVFLSGMVIGITLVSLLSFTSGSNTPPPATEKPDKVLQDGSEVYRFYIGDYNFVAATNPKGRISVIQVWGKRQ